MSPNANHGGKYVPGWGGGNSVGRRQMQTGGETVFCPSRAV